MFVAQLVKASKRTLGIELHGTRLQASPTIELRAHLHVLWGKPVPD